MAPINRSLPRSALQLRRIAIGQPLGRTAIRLQSTSSSSGAGAWQQKNPGLAGGLIGGSLVFVVGYIYYRVTGAHKAVRSVKETHDYFQSVKGKIQDTAPEPNKALDWLKDTSYTYVAFLPGGRATVDKAFEEVDRIRSDHGEELNKIVHGAHKELNQLATEGGADLKSAGEALSIIFKYLEQVQGLAKDVGKDVLENHPDLEKQYGAKLRNLKSMAEKQTGDLKKGSEDAYKKIQDAVEQGQLNSQGLGKLIQDTFDDAQKSANDAWSKALEAAQPYLKKHPELKKQIDDNADKLKNGDFSSIVSQLQEAAKSGNAGGLQKAVDDQLNRLHGMTDEAWTGAKARASIYLDKHPEILDLIEQQKDLLKRENFDELMDKLRQAARSGDFGPVESFIRQKLRDAKSRSRE